MRIQGIVAVLLPILFGVIGIVAPDRVEADWTCTTNPNFPCTAPTLAEACAEIFDFRNPGAIVAVRPYWSATPGLNPIARGVCKSKKGLIPYTDPANPTCPAGQVGHPFVPSGCVLELPHDKLAGVFYQQNAEPSTGVGSFVNPTTGNIFAGVVDFTTPGQNPLRFIRYHNGQIPKISGPLGGGWRHGYEIGVFRSGLIANPAYVYIELPDGKRLRFNRVGGTGSTTYVRADSDIRGALTHPPSQWVYTDPEDTKITLTQEGQLTSIVRRSGYVLTMAYDGLARLATVTDSYGRQITFAYGAEDNLSSITVPAGSTGVPATKTITYTYDSPYSGWYDNDGDGIVDPNETYAGFSRLIEVKHPNGAGTTSIQYLYEDTNFPFAVTGINDENANRYTTIGYDSALRVTLSEHAGGADRNTVVYGASSATVTSPLGKVEVYNFATITGVPKLTSINRQASPNSPASSSTMAYDGNGFVNSQTDWNGNVTSIVNDSDGDPTQITEAVGSNPNVQRQTTITLHATLRVPTQIVVPGRTTTFTYDAQGRMLTRTETDTTTQTVPYPTNGRTRTWTYTYNATGLINTIDGPLPGIGDKTTFTYLNGMVATVTNGLGHVTTVTSFNPRGYPLSVTDANGVVTNLEYDDRDRVTKVTVVDAVGGNAVTTLGYDLAGLLTSLTDPSGVTLAIGYDTAHRLTSIQDEWGARLEYTLDAMGGKTAIVRKNSGGGTAFSHTRQFDELGRLLRDIGAVGQTWTYGYDKNGNVTAITDPVLPVGNATAQVFDALDRLRQVTDAKGGISSLTSDARDNVTSVVDQRNLVTSYVYDGLDNPIQATSPDTGTTVFYYDDAGNVTQTVDARGVVTNMTYDGLGRVLSRTYPAAPAENVTYSYDDTTGGNKGIGRLTFVTDESGSTYFVYDVRGNVLSEARTIAGRAYTTVYKYTLADEVREMVYPSGRIVTYTRHDTGKISTVRTKASAGAPELTVASAIGYTALGPMQSLPLGNGLTTTLNYDLDYRLTDIDTAGPAAIQNLDLSYNSRDLVGAINDLLTPSRNQTFQYDELARLTQGTGVYGTIDYAYDAVGNRTQRTVTSGGAVVHDYAYAATSNRLVSDSRPGATRSFAYDAAGNAIQDAPGGGSPTHDLAYNSANRLSGATVGAVTSSYLLNALGERVLKNPDLAVSDDEARYHYDLAGRLLGESTYPGAGTVTVHKEYIWFYDSPIALFEDSVAQPEAIRYVHTDHLGAPQKATDGALALVWDKTSGPFGELEAVTGTLALNLRFPGQYLDAETGYRYNLLRDYDASLGRYLQSDPIGLAGGLNTYAYVGGNPVNSVDPTGKVKLTCLRYKWEGGVKQTVFGCPSQGGAGIILAAGEPPRLPWWIIVEGVGELLRLDQQPYYLEYNARNFRENLSRFTGYNPSGAHAHHLFPLEFAKEFAAKGINPNDPGLGAWWEAIPHLRNAAAYNKRWGEFLAGHPSAAEIMNFGLELASEYGL